VAAVFHHSAPAAASVAARRQTFRVFMVVLW
jgi:hypothetical protein